MPSQSPPSLSTPAAPARRDSPLAGPAPRPFRVPGIDGLRAVAVLLVLLYHLTPGAVPGGLIGVDVFFVISGFLITSLLLRERRDTGRIRLGAFWVRRARRLLPAVVLLILVCGSAATLLGGDVLVHLGAQVLGALTFSSNWILVAEGSSYFGGTAPELFRNLWSLAVEEQFYLVWPFVVLLLVLVPRRARVVLVSATAVASASAMALLIGSEGSTRVYYGTDTHSFGLALGALLAVLATAWPARREDWAPGRRRRAGMLGLAALLGLVALALLLPDRAAWLFPGGLAAASLLAFAVLRSLLVPEAPLGRVLEAAPLRWVGVRSYGLYLWHWPVFVLLSAALPGWPRTGAGGWALGGMAAGITVLAAAWSYAVVERPIRRDGFRRTVRLAAGWWRWGGSSALAATLAVLLVLATGAITASGIAHDTGKTRTQLQVEAGREAIEHDDRTPLPSAAPTRSAGPRKTVPGSDVLVIGDSVTLAAADEVQKALPGVLIDAAVSRQMNTAPQLVADHRAAGSLRPVVVLALGTNGPFARSVLDAVRAELGPQRELVLVSTQDPRDWEGPVNDMLAAYAQEYRNVELSNWHDAIQPNLNELNGDQVHFGGFGARVWTSCLMDALQRLAELPALRDDRDYAGLPRPS